MTQEGGEKLPISITTKTDLALTPEPTIHEIQEEIVNTILERLKDPKAVNLKYPNENAFRIAEHKVDPDYEHGSQRRFVLLDRSPLLGTDQICIAATDNSSTQYSRTQGGGLIQSSRGIHSAREISLTRFVQTATEKLTNQGTYYLIVLSENVTDFTGTLSRKGRAYSRRQYPPFAGKEGVPTFAEHWRTGNFQLAEVFHYDNAGQVIDFQESDYKDILIALKSAKVNLKETEKIAKKEEELRMAKQGANHLKLH